MIYYLRDDNNDLIGLDYNGNIYYYLKNIQEDIIGLLNSNYNKVATYEYDSWGNITSIKDSNGNLIADNTNIALINPFRYRSYYYDNETKLYYLNSRYYNPLWGRFINADAVINPDNNIIGHNLYTYVYNNIVNKTDFTGESAIAIGGAGALGIGTGGWGFLAILGIAAAAMLVNNLSLVTQMDISINNNKNNKKKKEKKKEEKNQNIYLLVDTKYHPPKVEYVGRTNNIDRRKSEHRANPSKAKLTMVPQYKNIAYAAARGKKQQLIMQYDTLKKGNPKNNQINGIRWSNPKFEDYMIAANSLEGGDTYVGG